MARKSRSTKVCLDSGRSIPNLDDYHRVVIPWGDGDNLYVYMKPEEQSQEIFIGSDENPGVGSRTKVITFSTLGENTQSVSLSITQKGKDIVVATYNVPIGNMVATYKGKKAGY